MTEVSVVLQDRGAENRRNTGRVPDSLVVVLGMHRSGTSAISRLVTLLGADIGPSLMSPSADNPEGYWENARIVGVHDGFLKAINSRWDDVAALDPRVFAGDAASGARRDLVGIIREEWGGSALASVKDPRLCRLWPLWRPVLEDLGISPFFVMAVRDPVAVALSLNRRDKMPRERAALLWLRHVIGAEQASRGRPRVFLSYDALVGDWRAAARRLVSGLQSADGPVLPVSPAAITDAADSFFRGDLRHFSGNGEPGCEDDSGHLLKLAKALFDVVESASRMSRDDDNAACLEAIDRIGREISFADNIAKEVAEARGQRQDQVFREREANFTRRIEDLERELSKSKTAPANPVEVSGWRALPEAEAYPRWLAARSGQAHARRDWIAERVLEWPFVPRFAFASIVREGKEPCLDLTVKSLAGQIVGEWRLIAITVGSINRGSVSDERVEWIDGGDEPFKVASETLAAADADWVGLLDAGCLLEPNALFVAADGTIRHAEWLVVYSDEDQVDRQGKMERPHFRPDFNLDLLRSMPYVAGFCCVRRRFFKDIGGIDSRWEDCAESDWALRAFEQAGGEAVGHLADVLLHRFVLASRGVRGPEDMMRGAREMVAAHLKRMRVAADVEPIPGRMLPFRVKYLHDDEQPLVSIVIPTKNMGEMLKRCVDTLLTKTEYGAYEILVVDNGTEDSQACEYLEELATRSGPQGQRVVVIRHGGPFNYSALNNRAVSLEARGEYLCLLNNDTAVVDGAWLSEMMAEARRPEVGVVGGKLYFPDERIQHAGVILGIGFGGPADHCYLRQPANTAGYFLRAQAVQDLSAVTAACLVTRRALWDAVGGLDEQNFAVAFNDVDYCLKVRKSGYLVVWTPFARVVHEGSASQRTGVEMIKSDEKHARFDRERSAFFKKWMPMIAFDPAYNRNLSSVGTGFSVETEGAPTWAPEWRPRARIVTYAADRQGCGEYRIIAPSRALAVAGKAQLHEGMRLFTPPEIGRIGPDSMVFQRQVNDHQIEAIRRMVELFPDVFRVFEIDDLITNLPLGSVHRRDIPKDIGTRLARAIGLCNRLVVSTEPLAARYNKLCDEVVVVENRLEAARWKGLAIRRNEGKRKPRVGWAGAVGHGGDLRMMEPIVKATAREVDWVFFGMCRDEMKRYVKETHPFVPLHDYPTKLASLGLDMAVAPLEDNEFNECKSNLRLLEYGAIGLPVLASSVTPYQAGLPVRLVKNRFSDWVREIRELALDRESARKEGDALKEAVMKDHMLDDGVDEWLRAWCR